MVKDPRHHTGGVPVRARFGQERRARPSIYLSLFSLICAKHFVKQG